MAAKILYLVLVGCLLPVGGQSVLSPHRTSSGTCRAAVALWWLHSFSAAWQMETLPPPTCSLALLHHLQAKAVAVEEARCPPLRPGQHLLCHLHLHHPLLSRTSPFPFFLCPFSGDWLSDVSEVGATGVVLPSAMWVFVSAEGRVHHN